MSQPPASPWTPTRLQRVEESYDTSMGTTKIKTDADLVASIQDRRLPLVSNQGVNKKRRQFLTAATSVVGAAGVVGVAVPFVASWNPSAKARAAGRRPVFLEFARGSAAIRRMRTGTV